MMGKIKTVVLVFVCVCTLLELFLSNLFTYISIKYFLLQIGVCVCVCVQSTVECKIVVVWISAKLLSIDSVSYTHLTLPTKA